MKITILQMDVVLPPPIYKNLITTDESKVHRTCGLVKSIERVEGGIIKVKALTGETYYISPASIQYWQEE